MSEIYLCQASGYTRSSAVSLRVASLFNLTLAREHMKIAATFSFEAAHRLPLLPDGHKCKNLHGHNYRMDVAVEGDLDERGFVMDYAELEDIVNPIVARLDHRFLNDIEGLENPTSEVMAQWIMNQIKPRLNGKTVMLRIYETPRYWVELSA